MSINIRELRDLVKRVRSVKGDTIVGPPESNNQAPENLPVVPGHTGTNTVTGKGDGGIIGDDYIQDQY